MSDSELNVLDLKKILKAHDLYKPELTALEMKQIYLTFTYKQALEAEGLYENGMSDQDIQDIYNALKKSEETAGNDNEYRDILNRTETNCLNIEVLIDGEPTANTNEEPVVDVTTVQPVSPKHQPIEPIKKNTNTPMEKKTNHPLLKVPKRKHSNGSIIYYQQAKILKLSTEERASIIYQYLLSFRKHQKKHDKKIKKIIWSDAIQPTQKKQFNEDLYVDFIPEPPEVEQKDEPETIENIKVVDSGSNSSPAKDKEDSISARPKRVVKRKNYADVISDDDDDFVLKKKSHIDLNESQETKWILNKKKALAKTSSYLSQGSDRTDKIFDKLKWGELLGSTPKAAEKSFTKTLQETMNLSDSDSEGIFPTEVTTAANIHKEEDQSLKSKNSKTMKAKRTFKKRVNYNKLPVQKKTATKENESPSSTPTDEIPTQHFYGNNDKNADVDESNNNKLENDEDLTNCPICNKPFPVSRIEVHASSCMQYEGSSSETFCEICNKHIPNSKFLSHKYECISKITEASVPVEKPFTRSQRSNPTNGFLCHICDKYIHNVSQSVHASNCIASG